MRWRDKLPRQSLMLLLACALILPAILALAVGFSQTQKARQRSIENEALTTAHGVMDRTDLVLKSDFRILKLIESTEVFAAQDWAAVEGLSQSIARELSQWRGVTVRDARNGELVFSSPRDTAVDVLRPLPATIPVGGMVEGVYRSGSYCPCVVLHMRARGQPNLVLSAYVDPAVFQEILEGRVEGPDTAAVVDAKGNFVARTRDAARRLGTPATVYVRRAAAKGGDGLYQGRTYEGLENFSGYTTSSLTGWSTHVAVDRSRIDGPRARATAAVATALAAALVLAVVLLIYAANDARVRKRDEKIMLELQKTEAVGQFTSIVVHDFRNLLAVTLSGLSQISRRTTDPDIERIAQAVRDAIARGNKLVNQLLHFARHDVLEVREVDLDQLLGGMDELLRTSLGDGVRLEWSIAEDARKVVANSDQLELALLNLAANARDAMEGKGELLIESCRDDRFIRLDVCDSGPGVPPHLRTRVFDAFFTTKDRTGTGLGLAQVAGAVQLAGGWIEIDNRPEGGARFKLYLKPAG
jgi:signal transduction histidine kinase